MAEWIDVNERLPEDTDNVFVLISDCYKAFDWYWNPYAKREVRYGHGVAWYNSTRKEWILESASYFEGTREELQLSDVKNYITHWQPLPEPPKEGEKKNDKD